MQKLMGERLPMEAVKKQVYANCETLITGWIGKDV